MTRAEPTSATDVPFLDLSRVHDDLKGEILESLGDLIDGGGFSNGPEVAEFEAAFARYCGTADAVGMASGLDALRLALLAAGVGPGDEVIVPALTFIATFEAVSQTGATPVPADISERDYNVDPDAVAAAITERTQFLLPVHLYGQMADMTALRQIAERHSLGILEDACQAHGAERDGVRAGAAGDAAAFSFYPGKNLGAMGDAGALVSDDNDLLAVSRALREHGQREKYRHEYVGFTSRLDTLQALVLSAKLPHLESWNRQRSDAAAEYRARLHGVGDLTLPPVPTGSSPVWHLYVVRTGDPEGLARTLRDRGVHTGRHYPEPPHLSGAYEHLGRPRGSFPVAEALAAEVLSLPIFPGITESELEFVAAAVIGSFDG